MTWSSAFAIYSNPLLQRYDTHIPNIQKVKFSLSMLLNQFRLYSLVTESVPGRVVRSLNISSVRWQMSTF